jgi:CRP/FNR family transcriptional regulator
MTDDWIHHFPSLQQLAPDVLQPLLENSKVVSITKGSRVFGPGSAPKNYLLLLSGSIRVQQMSESGREIVLYRVSAGESCALTTACLMGYEEYQAEAIVEEDAQAATIPRAIFDVLIGSSAEFRRFVFTAFSVRVTNLLRVIEEVAFERIDIRLAHKLLELARADDSLAITQQQLAAELGSAREVISRQLSEFQRRGWLQSSRGRIQLVDRFAIDKLANTA